ncbi:hypothetical protein [Acinetobacter variabilis]|uniref:Uncharacterized protein n=1 Tax=Acinetobacter variabilis TaxID=70346 RepID=N8WZL5_9GAMM|nr:hypothetical protein [Acinetobacter variabilis]ENV00355.1 hypothetical protein F969_00586 [Acinetobacter variabilis]
MDKMLWGDKPHSRFAVLDSVSPLEALKNSRAAMGLIAEKSNLTKTIEIMKWTKRAAALLGSIIEITHPALEVLKGIAQGLHDQEGLFSLWAMMDTNLLRLNDDKAFNDKAGNIAHQAINRWAELELKEDV